jgi:hypothetical protein
MLPYGVNLWRLERQSVGQVMRVKCSCRSLHDCRTPYHLGSGSLVVDEVLGSLVAAFNLRWFLRRTMERGGDFGLLSNSSQPYPNSYGLCRVNNGTLSIRSHVLTFTAPMISLFRAPRNLRVLTEISHGPV